MTRIALTDEQGRWFDPDKATKFEEGARWDGRTHISLATGSQWNHEALYRTQAGRWILHRWSQWQGAGEVYEEVDNAAAARWLVTNGHGAHEACATEYAALEIG